MNDRSNGGPESEGQGPTPRLVNLVARTPNQKDRRSADPIK